MRRPRLRVAARGRAGPRRRAVPFGPAFVPEAGRRRARRPSCARPRRASSSAIQPPIELPARCGLLDPELVELALGGVDDVDRSWPGARSARSRRGGRARSARSPRSPRASSGTTWRQTRSLQRIPWKRTSGSPEPSRSTAVAYPAAAGSRHISRIGGPPRPGMSKTLGQVEAVAFVEHPVAVGARLEVGGDPLAVAALEHRRQQRAAEAAALPARFDPEVVQVPVVGALRVVAFEPDQRSAAPSGSRRPKTPVSSPRLAQGHARAAPASAREAPRPPRRRRPR